MRLYRDGREISNHQEEDELIDKVIVQMSLLSILVNAIVFKDPLSPGM